MSTDNDQATVDRLCLLTYTSDQEGEPHDCVECADAARAIIDAIRKGEVPGVVTDDMIQTTKLMVYEAAMEEIVALRAEVAELKRELQKDWEANCCDLMADAQREKARADKAEAEAAKCNDLCAEIGGDDPAECLEIVKAGADMHLAVVKEADRATAERDRLAGLLCDAGICLLSKDEGRQVSMAAQIDAALAEVGKS